jgi:uncharacterized caspase-like protein
MPRAPKNKALVVGISNYPPGIKNLPAVASDVREIAKVLGSKSGRFGRDAVVSITNRQAKRKEVMKALRSVLRAATGATVFVYLAGHGDAENERYFFITHDAKYGELAQTAIPLNEIKSLFDASPCSQVFLWLDFCHSGGILARRGNKALQESKDEVVKRTLSVVQGKGKVIIAACTEEQSAYEDSSHGFFTGALLRGLRGEAKMNDEVTVSSLYDFIDRQIGSSRQRPMLFGRMTGRIVLMHYDDHTSSPNPITKPKLQDGEHQTSSPKSSKAKATQGTVRSSGKWTLLGDDLFFESQKVTRNPDRTFTVQVRSSDPELDASIQRLSPDQFRRSDNFAFAHQNDASTVRIQSVSSESSGRGQLWTISLEPVEQQGFNPMHETAYSDGTRQYSADDIAELRARRILLDERSTPRGLGQLDVLSLSGRQQQVACPIRDVYQAHSTRKSIWPRLARLKAIALLKSTGTVEHVLEFAVEPRPRGQVRITFRGQRPMRYHNETPAVIAVEGICKVI